MDGVHLMSAMSAYSTETDFVVITDKFFNRDIIRSYLYKVK